jgi:hypothetical protein
MVWYAERFTPWKNYHSFFHGLLLNEEMRKYFIIYEGAAPHIWLPKNSITRLNNASSQQFQVAWSKSMHAGWAERWKKAQEFNHKKYDDNNLTIKEKESMKIYFIVAKKKHQNIVNCVLVWEHWKSSDLLDILLIYKRNCKHWVTAH